jgi:hypothetical protein
MAVWECPGCHRRVPDRIAVCHCGTRRDQAPPLPATERSARAPVPVPRAAPRARVDVDDDREPSAVATVLRDSWLYLVLFTLALTGAAVWGARWHPPTMPPLLGGRTYERPSPSPPPARPGQRR